MKKAISLLLTLCLCFAVCGCGASPDENDQFKAVKEMMSNKTETTENVSSITPTEKKTETAGPVDVDLTKLSATMVYSEVYNMLSSPEKYLGKTIKMTGRFNCINENNRYYFCCIISDATACCAQGLEFVLKDGGKYPDDYPPLESEITVTGIFDTYMEGTTPYCQLINAVMA